MIFSELYGAYYKTVAEILKAAVTHPIDKSEMYKIIKENAFDESSLIIEPALTQQRWQLLNTDGSTNIKNAPTMPMTLLEKALAEINIFRPADKTVLQRCTGLFGRGTAVCGKGYLCV